jgi:hypothetical protein
MLPQPCLAGATTWASDLLPANWDEQLARGARPRTEGDLWTASHGLPTLGCAPRVCEDVLHGSS